MTIKLNETQSTEFAIRLRIIRDASKAGRSNFTDEVVAEICKIMNQFDKDSEACKRTDSIEVTTDFSDTILPKIFQQSFQGRSNRA